MRAPVDPTAATGSDAPPPSPASSPTLTIGALTKGSKASKRGKTGKGRKGVKSYQQNDGSAADTSSANNNLTMAATTVVVTAGDNPAMAATTESAVATTSVEVHKESSPAGKATAVAVTATTVTAAATTAAVTEKGVEEQGEEEPRSMTAEEDPAAIQPLLHVPGVTDPFVLTLYPGDCLQDVRQFLHDLPESSFLTCFQLALDAAPNPASQDGTATDTSDSASYVPLNDFVEVGSIPGLVNGCSIRVVPDSYTELAVRLHVKRLNDLLRALVSLARAAVYTFVGMSARSLVVCPFYPTLPHLTSSLYVPPPGRLSFAYRAGIQQHAAQRCMVGPRKLFPVICPCRCPAASGRWQRQ